MTNGRAFDKPTVYEIRVQGTLERRWSDWFPGLAIIPQLQAGTGKLPSATWFGPVKIGLVTILMHPHPRTFAIIIDQTAIGFTHIANQSAPDRQHLCRDSGPCRPLRVAFRIPVSAAVGKPAHLTGRCHTD